MNKRIVLAAVASLFGMGAFAQSIVTTLPQYKSAVLEELTGLKCTFCPDGHVRADAIKAANPNRVVLINIHTGGYAVPSGSEPDMRTPEGDLIGNLAAPAGYPAGSVNRRVFPASDNNTAMGRGDWAAACDVVMAEVSPVNVGATTTYNSSNRQLTVDLEAYYTANSASATNYIHVVLMQDSILGPQTGGTTYNPGNYVGGQYVHSKVFRTLLTAQWGDPINTTTAGSLYQNQIVYTLPATINGEPLVDSHCKIAVFVTENQEDIYTGIEVPFNATNDGNNGAFYGAYANLNAAVLEGNNPDTASFTMDFQSALSAPADFVFELTTDAPGDWNGYYSVGGNDLVAKDTISVNNASALNLGIGVIPGATGAVAKYTLTMHPLSDPNTLIVQDVYVISGITDLVVNGTGSWGDGGSYNWESLYTDGLNYAGNTAYDATTGFVFEQAEAAGALGNVNNIYLNIGWSFPSFTDAEANAIVAFLNTGKNAFVAGQDIGWDIMSGSGYGTAATINLFNNYFQATYVADGTTSSNSITAEAGDAVFSGVSNSSVVDVYGGNLYPDQINPKTGAMTIFRYPANRSAGIRYENGYKVVYMGVGMEHIQNVGVKDEIIKLSHDWFYGLVSTEEFDELANAGLIVYPNPSNGEFTVTVNEAGQFDLNVVNILGEVVFTQKINNVADTKIAIDLKDVPAGVYFVQISNNETVLSRKIVKQ